MAAEASADRSARVSLAIGVSFADSRGYQAIVKTDISDMDAL